MPQIIFQCGQYVVLDNMQLHTFIIQNGEIKTDVLVRVLTYEQYMELRKLVYSFISKVNGVM